MCRRSRAAFIFGWVVGFAALWGVSGYELQAALARRGTAGPITAFVPELVKVRSGPGTVYGELGQLTAGESAPAIGRSQTADWIQITYPAGPGGKGWVYASLVTLEGGPADSLPVVEAPPTATLPPTPAGGSEATATPSPTRLPTFTPGPTVSAPTFDELQLPGRGFPPALLIMGLFGIGVLGGVMAFLRRNA